MNMLLKWLQGLLMKVQNQLMNDFAAILMVIVVFAGIAEEELEDNAEKKQKVMDDMFAEFEKDGGIDLPKWFRGPLAKRLLPHLIDFAVALAQGKDLKNLFSVSA